MASDGPDLATLGGGFRLRRIAHSKPSVRVITSGLAFALEHVSPEPRCWGDQVRGAIRELISTRSRQILVSARLIVVADLFQSTLRRQQLWVPPSWWSVSKGPCP